MSTFKTILENNNVTFEQASKATLVESNGCHYAIVESQTEAGTTYEVRYNVVFGKLTCQCAAGQKGTPCWHKRAAVAQIEIARLEARRDREIEQALSERTPEEIEEQSMIARLIGQGIDSETAFRVATAKGTHYSEDEIERDQIRYGHRDFRLLK